MQSILLSLRAFTFGSVALRLAMAMFCGGMIGFGRARKHRAAGFRTYMLVCLGAALTMLLSQYESILLETRWAAVAADIGIRTDVSRFGAQVINGIGFLGAGTIVVTGKQQVTGLTTAAGLWASACMGLAIGAGFYECVILAFFLILLSMRLFPILDDIVRENAKDINFYVELDSLDHIGQIINKVKAQNVQIFDVDIERGREKKFRRPSAVFSVRLNERLTHTQMLSALSELQCILFIEEI